MNPDYLPPGKDFAGKHPPEQRTVPGCWLRVSVVRSKISPPNGMPSNLAEAFPTTSQISLEVYAQCRDWSERRNLGIPRAEEVKAVKIGWGTSMVQPWSPGAPSLDSIQEGSQPPAGVPVPRYLFAGFPAQAHPTRFGHAAPVARSSISRLAAWAFAFTPHVQARPP